MDLVTEAASKVAMQMLKEAKYDTFYGQISTDPRKPTFDDPNQQAELKNDTINMLAKLDDNRFKLFWDKRMVCTDPDTVDAIYSEYFRRFGGKNAGNAPY